MVASCALAESVGLIDKLRRHGLHMPNDANALAIPPQAAAPREGDYQAFCAALSESERGRAFLAEYARRNRNADTEMLLAALDRLTALVRADAAALDRLRDELRMLLIAIRLARPEIDAANMPAKAARLTVLLETLERRIEAMAGAKPAEIAPPEAALGTPAMPDEPALQDTRARLAVVPPPDEPELPIPSPASVQAPAITLVHDPEKHAHGLDPWVEPVFGQDHVQKKRVQKQNAISDAMMPEVAFVGAPAGPAVAKKIAAKPAAPRPDALAAIMALSEDERLALFT
jgi:hypothetical protein